MRRFVKERTEKDIRYDTALIQKTALMLAGIFSILFVMRSLPYISFSAAVVSFVSAAVCCGLSALFRADARRITIYALGVILTCAVLAAVGWEEFFGQMSVVFESFAGALPREYNVTFFMAVLGAALSSCFFMAEMIFRKHWVMYIIVTAVFTGAPLLGVSVGFLPALLGLAFQIMFWVMNAADKKHSRFSAVTKTKRSVTIKISLYMAAALAVSACAACAVTAIYGTELSDAVYRGEEIVSRGLQQITGAARNSDTDGRVSGGNNYQTGEKQLEVTLLAEPNETLYLKGFSGDTYTGGKWEAKNDMLIFRQMADTLQWQEWESWIRGMYNSLYFIMNMATAREARPRTVFLTHTNAMYKTVYSPYYSSRPNMNSSTGGGYVFNYYEQSQMDIDWDNVDYDFRTASIWYRQVQDAYMQEMPKFNLQVPEEIVPRLAELCRGHRFGSVDDVTAFIIDTLRAHASYTLTPGRAPLNEDIVEYFLFENHEGYCVHFASAATLMYRLCGVPARYVSGYVLEPSDFTLQDGDLWTAEVTDMDSHAWTEIFIEDYGWTPVEVTPSSAGDYNTVYPGLDVDFLADISIDGGQEQDDTEDAGNTSSEYDGATESTAAAAAENNNDEQDIARIILIAAVGTGLFLMLLLAVGYRRDYMTEKIKRMNCREVFGRFITMLHYSGYMSGYDGTEDDFAKRLSEEPLPIGREEAERMAATVSRAAYGNTEPDKDETAFVREIYFRAAHDIESGLKGVKKLKFNYLWAFC